MSTRATVHFQYNGKTEAIVYRHTDGYPEGLGEDLKQFFADVETQCSNGYGGTRFNDPTYLAAKFVVWQAMQYAENKEKPLDFLSIGVMMEDPYDIAYRYLLECSTRTPPKIKVENIYDSRRPDRSH